MIRSLRSGVSGLRSNQIRMDVIGNNIANVNTAAFKKGRAAFADLLGQNLVGVGRSGGGGGVNPAGVGMGVGISSIDRAFTQGGLEYTNLSTDLALSGDGFFVAKGKDGQELLTRAGNFFFDGEGRLSTANGLAVQGWAFDDNGTVTPGLRTDVVLDINRFANSAPTPTTSATLRGNLSANAPFGNQVDINGDPVLDANNNPVPNTQHNLSTVVYDSQGKAHNLMLTLAKTGDNQWTLTNARLEGSTDPIPGAAGQIIEFDAQGKLISPLTMDLQNIEFPGEVNTGTITLDFQGLTQLAGTTTAIFSGQDGVPPGRLEGFAINPEGILSLNYSNGTQRPLFQLGIGNVSNPNGLQQLGDNMFAVTAAAGDLIVGRAGFEIETSVISGALEMSNVDLTTEFTDMIVTQRGFQASARMVTVSDDMLQEVVSLKR